MVRIGAERLCLRTLRREDNGLARVRPEDRDLLDDVAGNRRGQVVCHDERQRLRGQVDMLLVLGEIDWNRLVAELRKLDADLERSDVVDARAGDRPIAGVRSQGAGAIRNSRLEGKNLANLAR